jgi:DNA mismatch endonuclease (patch repair protein)
MAAVRSRGNASTEVAFMRLLRGEGLSGWRRHRRLPGTPDFAFPAARVAVFVHGCFWHGCPRHYRPPRSNGPFWRRKVEGNRRRDRRAARALRALGWRAVTVWEHDLAGGLRRVERALA